MPSEKCGCQCFRNEVVKMTELAMKNDLMTEHDAQLAREACDRTLDHDEYHNPIANAVKLGGHPVGLAVAAALISGFGSGRIAGGAAVRRAAMIPSVN